jgi:hypothetical protein
MPCFALCGFSCAPVSWLFALPPGQVALEVELSPEARLALGVFREAERRRREYCGRRF